MCGVNTGSHCTFLFYCSVFSWFILLFFLNVLSLGHVGALFSFCICSSPPLVILTTFASFVLLLLHRWFLLLNLLNLWQTVTPPCLSHLYFYFICYLRYICNFCWTISRSLGFFFFFGYIWSIKGMWRTLFTFRICLFFFSWCFCYI